MTRLFTGLGMDSCTEKESFLTTRYEHERKIYTLVISARPRTSDEDYSVLLKQCRIANGLTQKEVAESIGVRPADITDFERGRIITSGTVLEKVMAFIARERAAQVEAQLCKIRAEKGPLWIANDSVARILKRDKDAYVALRKDIAQKYDRYLYIPQEQWPYAAKDICERMASSLPKDQLRCFHVYAAPGIWFAMRGNLTINPRTRHAWISVAGKEILCSQQDALELIHYFQKINREIDEHAAKGERVSIEGFYRLF